MNKSQKMKKATRKARNQNIKQLCKKIVLFPWKVCKKVWSWIVVACKYLWYLLCRVCSAVWNWLKSIDIIGMINLTLLVAIIVLFSSLIADFVCCNKCPKSNTAAKANVVSVSKEPRKVVQRKFNTKLPLKADVKTGITPKIKTIGVKKPQIIREVSVPVNELPQKQNLSGDVIIEATPTSATLQNGVKVNGNLFIQNFRKYTLPCDATINGNLFIRNVDKLSFCGKFTVKGNIYVNRQSSFGPLPDGTRIDGNIIL